MDASRSHALALPARVAGMSSALTISEAAAVLAPRIPRRELARRMQGVPPVGARYGGPGRRASTYPLTTMMQVHAAWVREKLGHLPDVDLACQNSDGQRCAP
jgi:hypothetical protein